MYPYQVLVVDDEELSRNATIVSLELYIVRENIHAADSIRTAKEILESTAVDVAILDISMQNENGFQLAEYIQENYPTTPYIFLTGYAQFALAGYHYQPLGFLIKPVNAVALGDLLAKVQPVKERNEKTHKKIGVTFNGGFAIVDVDHVLYIEKVGRNVVVHLTDKDITLPKHSLEQMEDIFQEYGFVRVHQSFLVAIQAIEVVEADPVGSFYNIKLKGTEHKIPLSRTKYSAVKKILQQNNICFL